MKKKAKIIFDKKKKSQFFGETFFDKGNKPTGKIKVYLHKHVKKGKLDKAELASTIKHELMHFNNPKMTEKEIYKKTAKTKIPMSEQAKLLKKLKMTPDFKPGDLISKVNESKDSIRNQSNETVSKTRLSIMGLI